MGPPYDFAPDPPFARSITEGNCYPDPLSEVPTVPCPLIFYLFFQFFFSCKCRCETDPCAVFPHHTKNLSGN